MHRETTRDSLYCCIRIPIPKGPEQSRLTSSSWTPPPELRKIVRRGSLPTARACQPPAATRFRCPTTCVWQEEGASPRLDLVDRGVLGGAKRNATLAVQRVESSSNDHCMVERRLGAHRHRAGCSTRTYRAAATSSNQQQQVLDGGTFFYHYVRKCRDHLNIKTDIKSFLYLRT